MTIVSDREADGGRWDGGERDEREEENAVGDGHYVSPHT